MEQVTLSIEDLTKLVEDAAEKASEKASEKALQKMLECFGLENNEEGKKIAHHMGDSAKRAAAFWDEFSLQGRRSAAKFAWGIIKLTLLAAIGFAALKLGLSVNIK